MPKFINGPVNYAHLRGKINGIQKNIYLFMDTHNKIDNQTRCESFNSIDITYYLYKIIKDTEESIDFFMEIQQKEINKLFSFILILDSILIFLSIFVSILIKINSLF